ncbi:MAG TPA: calcium-binding protein [Patescibacteria group bacterium]|nr:calcium-binding protein [Patescibacteria group bacterium]
MNKRILLLLLLPFVAYGVMTVIKQAQASEVEEVDLIEVTYEGGGVPDPIFTLDDMKPGDVEKRCFKIKNVNETESFDVLMRAIFGSEEKDFSGILEVIVDETGFGDFYGGSNGFKTMRNFFDELEAVNLGNFDPGQERAFCMTVKFPPEAGNEYQNARLKFDLSWSTEISDNKIPPECRHMTFGRIVEGTDESERIYGSVQPELILAYGGNDKVWASSDSDCIVGGEGNDHLVGESGDEVILGGPGNDKIDGGYGNDTVYGGEGNDKIETGSGKDKAYGGLGNDNIDLGSDDDYAEGGEGQDNIDGESGNDEIYGGAGNDELRGGSDNDKVYGEAGNDTMRGNSGNDFLDGGTETDTLHGNSDTDQCVNGESVSSCEL